MAGTKWQYLIRRETLGEVSLDELGNDGWELTSVIMTTDGPIFFFKRPQPTLAEAITLEQRKRYIDEPGVTGDEHA